MISGSPTDRDRWIARGRPRLFLRYLLIGDVAIVAFGAFAFYAILGPSVNSTSSVDLPLPLWAALGALVLTGGALPMAWFMTTTAVIEPTRVRARAEGVDLDTGWLTPSAVPTNVLWSQFQPAARPGWRGYVSIAFSDPSGTRTYGLVLSDEQFRGLLADRNRPPGWSVPERLPAAGVGSPRGPT